MGWIGVKYKKALQGMCVSVCVVIVVVVFMWYVFVCVCDVMCVCIVLLVCMMLCCVSVSFLIWELGTKLGSSGRAASNLTCGPSLSPPECHIH